MTPSQADQVAAVMAVLRPDWTKVRIASVAADTKVQAQDGRVALVAAVLCATDPRATAPGFLLTDTAVWTAARHAVDPTSMHRPQPPPIDQMCVCGRPQHDPNPACDEPRQAIRQRPASAGVVAREVLAARRAIRENRERAAQHHDDQEPA